MICKYFIPSHRLPFQCVDGIFMVQFLVWCHPTYLFLLLLPNPKSWPRPTSSSLPPVFFQEFYGFKSYFPVFNPFRADFCIWCKQSSFILLLVACQFSQQHSLKRWSFSHFMLLAPLPWLRWPHMCGCISGLCILFHWSRYLFLCQRHTVWWP